MRPLTGASWDIETVDSSGHVGFRTSIALDADDHPHISYCDITNYDLKYATFNGSTWAIETVDSIGNVGYFTSLALDAEGKPHINYFDDANYDLKYAAFNGASWDIETVDSTGFVGTITSIAVDKDNNPHISYFYGPGDNDLKYAYAYCGYTLAGDINDNCKFDLIDFSIMAANWLIDCDITPGDPACVPK